MYVLSFNPIHIIFLLYLHYICILGKYFRMLSVRLPRDAIKAKMLAEGIDPSFLDKNPTDLICSDGTSSSGGSGGDGGKNGSLSSMLNSRNNNDEIKKIMNEEKIVVSLHPLYQKFFKMLKVRRNVYICNCKHVMYMHVNGYICICICVCSIYLCIIYVCIF